MGKNSSSANRNTLTGWRKWWRYCWRGALALLILSVLLVLLLRWVNPPISAIRIIRGAQAVLEHRPLQAQSCWLSLAEFGPNLPLAVIASEDQQFSTHYGFDLDALSKAMRASGRKRGASTISQQVAKNMFLWHGRSYVRKGLEAYFTVLIETLWSKRRILEVYLNVVEFGDGVFGGCAGTHVQFNKAPARLSAYQAALIAATLPNPHILHANKPTVRVSRRANWIVRQMQQLGGAGYLAQL
jgi:monofunctional glycosyltransferase